MTTRKGSSAVFESLSGTGFPTRISYEFTPPDALKVRLEGRGEDGKPLASVFPMRRKACAAN
jgi:hypothetical protein